MTLRYKYTKKKHGFIFIQATLKLMWENTSTWLRSIMENLSLKISIKA